MRSLFGPYLGLVRLTVLACVLLFVSVLRADEVDVAVALDKKASQLTIEAENIPDVLADLGRRVGIKITLDERAINMLPHGAQTRLKKMTAQNASLRELLPQILGALGMTYRLEDNGVLVYATAPLERINRRATWEDLKLLRRCNDTDFTPEAFADFRIQYRITSKIDAPKMLSTQLAKAGRGTVAQMLEAAAGALGWVWFPDGDHLVIRTAQAQTANRMARRITCRYTHEPLARILIDLADKADTPISFEPGLMLKLPPNVAQSTDLILQNSSIRQAFEVLSANTGVRYEIEREGIRVTLAEGVGVDASSGVVVRRRASSYVGKISIPSADGAFTYDFVLRAEDLPEDILEYRRQIIEEYIQKIRAEMAPDGTIHAGDKKE